MIEENPNTVIKIMELLMALLSYMKVEGEMIGGGATLTKINNDTFKLSSELDLTNISKILQNQELARFEI
jgi:hypothetical protein